ncbi:ATP-binding protein [Sphingobacterium sp. SRCM116780]|uniref:hybrid sensor histidine kinase/response regulator n=1 Tax=Sphingobacterium sp. SRCM116780 TaxID=2907623 RepID=UPI001F470239|nr:ATP-binding protein [Sphingobacterium sp. SRCM116780]UIR56498.1 ATP-binding protein [Sphingobacterium sp. SRCM116780]
MQTTQKNSNTSTKRLRIILLISTLILFISCFVVFVSQYQQYKNIQVRIENIYASINNDNSDFSLVISKYNEAENYFRLFSIDFDKKNYSNYENKLIEIKTDLDSLIALNFNEPNSIIENNFNKKESLAKNFILLKLKIDSLLSNNKKINSLPDSFIKKSTKSSSKIVKTPEENSSEKKTTNYVVTKKKSLLKRIFDKQNDTIFLDQIEKLKQEREIIIQEHLKELNTQQDLTNKKLEEVNTYFQKLRQSERKLLANNFSILHELNKLIRDIQDYRLKERHKKTNAEIKSLIAQTEVLKWEMIICFITMFLMICFIIYYQYFTTYYENRLIEEKKYVKKLADEKTAILAEISHEIRTPINSLLGIVDILKKQKEQFKEQDRLLIESAFSSIQSTSKTINDILNLSKLESKDHANTIGTFDINMLVQDVISIHQNQASLKNIKIEYNLVQNENSSIKTDEFKIRQILTNLLSNAIKYSEKGIIKIAVKVNNNKLFITVSDQGIGIAKNMLPSIFRKYFTVNSEVKIDSGVGLGLYITKQLVRKLKGEIKVNSVINQGTTFDVEIPVMIEKHIKSVIKRINQISDLPKNINWLIVDDNSLNLLYMKQFFQHNETVYTASNGVEALEIIEKKDINIIITDINMPMLSGDQLLKKLKENSKTQHLIIIGTSSDNEQVLQLEQLHQVKFDGILIKPFNEATLANILLKAISK